MTDIHYDYETIKRGCSVVAVRFIYKSKILEEVEESQMTIEQWQADTCMEVWEETMKDFKFSAEQIKTLREVLVCVPDYKLPQSMACCDVIDLRRYHYMRIKVAEMKLRPNVKNCFSYLLKMLKQDADI